MRRFVILMIGLSGLMPSPVSAEILLGSDYGWYASDAPGTPNQNFLPYNVIQNYAEEAPTIDAQLLQMRDAGQNALAIPLNPEEGYDSFSLLDETGGNLNASDLSNLIAFIAQVKADGFQSILLRFNFQGTNAPLSPTTTQAALVVDSQFITNIMNEVVLPSGMNIVTDLCGECIVTSMTAAQISNVQYLWQNYSPKFGTENTVGISTNHIWNEAGVQTLISIFGGVYPSQFGFEMYTDDITNGIAPTPAQQIVALNGILGADGINRTWLIPETYDDDPATANSIAEGLEETGQSISALYQWPVVGPTDPDEVIPPIDISAYDVVNNVPECSSGLLFLPAVAMTLLARFCGRQNKSLIQRARTFNARFEGRSMWLDTSGIGP